MIRSCFLWFKHVLYAVSILALVGCLAEVALRVYDSATAQVTRRELYDRGLVCKSWFVHHTLKPSHAFALKSPDTGERVRMAINSRGLRGRECLVPKPPEVYRVLCLGDESTLAPAIAEGETFCAALQTDLAGSTSPSSVEVVNGGVPDYCPLLSYLLFRHELMALEPDLIVVSFDMSDVADDYLLRRHATMDREGVPVSYAHPALEMPRSAGKCAREGTFLLPQFARQRLNCLLAERTLGENSRSIASPRCRYLWLEDQPPDWSVHINLALSPLKHLDELARSCGARLVVAALPAPWQVSSSASNGEGVREQAGVAQDALFRSQRPFATLAEFCQTHNIPFCNMSEAFVRADQPERLFLKNAAAFSAAGHALYARELASFLRQQLSTAPADTGDYAPLPPQARLAPR
jgi:hypothetical protein